MRRILLVAGTILLALAVKVSAEDFAGLKIELGLAAENVIKFLKEEDRTSVAIGDFIAPPVLQANFSNELKRVLKSSLEEKKIAILDAATYAITGRYRVAKDADADRKTNSGLTGLLIEFEIIEQNTGKIAQKFARQIFDNRLLATASGVNSTLTPTASRDERNAHIAKALENPQFKIGGSKVLVDTFGVEVLVISGVTGESVGTELKGLTIDSRTPSVRKDEKQPFVELKRDEIYAIRLINNADFDVCVQLSVDGLNVFQFSEVKDAKGKQFTHWVVPAKSNGVIPGWHKSHSESLRFKITDLPGSAAFKAKSTGSVGVINALFSAVLVGPGKNATDESTKGAEVATGFGPSVAFKTEPVEVKMGAPRASVSVRYGK